MPDTVVVVEPATQVVLIDAPAQTVVVPSETVTILTDYIQGPQGPAGTSGDANYVHNQNVPATDWVIDHDLGKYPAITLIDSAGTVVIGEIEHITTSQAVARFSVAFSGKAVAN